MENPSTLMYDAVDSSHSYNSTDNITYDMDLEENEFLNLTRFIIPVLVGLITAFGLAGNIMIISVFVLHKAIRGITNSIIMSLAIADLLILAFCIPFKTINPAIHFWPLGDIWCRIHTYLEYVCYFASMYTLVLLSVDRYIALVHPIRAIMLRTKQNCYIALISLWSLIILGNIPFLFMAKEKNVNPEFIEEQRIVCALQVQDDSGSPMWLFISAYLLPLSLLCVLYGHMLKVFLTGKTPTAHKNGGHLRLQAKKRVTKMAVLGVSVCVVCRLPLQIIMLYIHVSGKEHIAVTLASIIYAAECMAYINSCINPILYTFHTNTFRDGIKNMVSCRKTKHNKRAIYSSVKRTTYSAQ